MILERERKLVILQSNHMLTPEKQLVCTAMETELFFSPTMTFAGMSYDPVFAH